MFIFVLLCLKYIFGCTPCSESIAELIPQKRLTNNSGPEKGVITKGVFSLEESLESLNSLESLEDGRPVLYSPQSGGSLKSLASLENSLESLENGLF